MATSIAPTGSKLPRNKHFADGFPLKEHTPLQLNHQTVRGPVRFLDPTQAHYDYVTHTETPAATDGSSDDASGILANAHEVEDPLKSASNIDYKWTSRDNRKGRHAVIVKPAASANTQFHTPPVTSSPREVAQGIWRMFTYFPVWDVSYLVAVVFTWGSVIWVINAFFCLLPLTNPESTFKNEVLYGGGITSLIGATVFEVGSVLLMLEAMNKNHAGCFGWAITRIPHDHNPQPSEKGQHRTHRLVPDHDGCTHHHNNRSTLVSSPKSNTPDTTNTSATKDSLEQSRSWSWLPTRNELRTKYTHDIGFIASSWQMLGATVFWISGFTAMPGIINHLSPRLEVGVYWSPQIIGGACFIVSGALFMIETQRHWWLPAPWVLGWHIGAWNLVGGVGFTLCPIFGLLEGLGEWAELQVVVSTFWGELFFFAD